MAHDTETLDQRTRAATRLALPAVGTRTPEQVRGAACVWCEDELSNADAVDLGQRSGNFAGQVTRWFPRGCARCVRVAVRTEYANHAGTCEQCADDPTVCEIRRDLRRLALEVRRLVSEARR
ncbi:hypothetical protein [Streptomyces colonosanans]|uniref:Uncharacterized protein n=1 Tax=Streptomyces colonosanans TaxID=1428652 RepID=A0A1S2PAY3_9ACTN|nr:hypothetical protein [Streptomyces colonosanans]OIJ90901.1 hypothetical protein BIV24_17125 [Streptomyces colonosanans]